MKALATNGGVAVAISVVVSVAVGCTIDRGCQLPVLRNRSCDDPECEDSVGARCPTDCDWDPWVCGDGDCDAGEECGWCPEDCEPCDAGGAGGLHDERTRARDEDPVTIYLELVPGAGEWTPTSDCFGWLGGDPVLNMVTLDLDMNQPAFVPLEMEFSFYGAVYTRAWVSPDGYIELGSERPARVSEFKPEVFHEAPRVAVAFRDLTGGVVEVYTGGGGATFRWIGFEDEATREAVGELRIILRADGVVNIQWEDVTLATALVGVTSGDRTGGRAALFPACP